MDKTITLKDIAGRLGVTTTTVHRALQGKPGVGEETRALVLKTADEMGYRANYLAAALKRRAPRVAVVLPEATGENRYYYANLWQGARTYFAGVPELGVELHEAAYPAARGTNAAALAALLDEEGLDGVLTVPVEEQAATEAVNALAEKGVRVAYMGSDNPAAGRFCCVKSRDEMAGALAAELLCAFESGAEPKTVVLLGHFGYLGLRDQPRNAAGFTEYLAQNAPHYTVAQVHGEDDESVARQLAQALRGQRVYAVYSASARYTVLAQRTAAVLKVSPKIIGSDLFPESRRLLAEGKLAAIIDKRIPEQGELAAGMLINATVKNEKPQAPVLELAPRILLRGSLENEEGVE